MSGVRIEVEADDSQFREAFRQLLTRSQNLRPAFKNIGEVLVNSTDSRFARQVDPDGNPWAPISEEHLKYKKRHGFIQKILQMRGDLRASIVYRAEDDRVLVGTNKVYGAIHQLGGEITIPARAQVNAHNAKGKFMSREKAGQTKGIKAPTKGKAGRSTRISFASHAERKVTMPARPYLGVSTSDGTKIMKVLRRYLETDE